MRSVFYHRIVRTPLVAILVVFSLILIAGAKASRPQDKDEPVRVDTDLVLLNVLVRDKRGLIVPGLRVDQFEVLVDGVERPLESFSSESAAVSFGVIYDLHPTTTDRTKAVIDSLRSFKSTLKTDDDIFLVAFNMQGEQTFDFIPTLDQLERHMADPDRRDLRSLYDATYLASDRIRSSRNPKRVLVIISDSADHHSRRTLSQLRAKVTDIRSELYAIILNETDGYGYSDITHKGRQTNPFSGDASPLDRAAMQNLAMKSGGSAFFSGSDNAFQLFAIYTQIGIEMRSHYTLGFTPASVDEKTHNITVRLKNLSRMKDLVLSYRPSYRSQRTEPKK